MAKKLLSISFPGLSEPYVIEVDGEINPEDVEQAVLSYLENNPIEKGQDGVSVTHEWNGTTLTITSASGTSSADLKGGKGNDGTSVSVSSVSESTEDGGSNVATFSDGKTLTVKNGKTGSPGADGKTPIKGVDYWTDADQEAIVQQVIAALGTPVFGTVDGDNNIILTGNLADGTYTLKYEDAEGNVTEIGSVTVGTPSIVNLIDEVGYTNDVRYSASNHGTKDAAGYICTGPIQLKPGDILLTSGANFDASENNYCNIACIPNDDPTSDWTIPTNSTSTIDAGDYLQCTIDDTNNLMITGGVQIGNITIRLTGFGSGENLIVTKNQLIE